jgi:7-cyano-7-deazaguanine synthase
MSESDRRGTAVVLLSGGMDSATALAVARQHFRTVVGLTVLYGQRHRREVQSARRLARHFRVTRHEVLRLPLRRLLSSVLTDDRRPVPDTLGQRRPGGIPATYVPARNTILLAIALGFAESLRASAIYIGANAIDYSGYPDCRPEYFRAFAHLARLATRAGVELGREVKIEAPLLRMSKADIVRLGERLHIPWKMTWSCYAGGRQPCGRCDACVLRARGFRGAGIPDPLTAGTHMRSSRSSPT